MLKIIPIDVSLHSYVAHLGIPGYFPTPPYLARYIVNISAISPGQLCIDPSAGAGALALEMRRANALVEVAEINPLLQEILSQQSFKLVAKDILKLKRPIYQRVVCNPPFLMAITHIQHYYYHLLASGGKMVAIAPDSLFMRKTESCRRFRQWLRANDTLTYALPDGTFLQSERPTCVKTRLIIINKK